MAAGAPDRKGHFESDGLCEAVACRGVALGRVIGIVDLATVVFALATSYGSAATARRELGMKLIAGTETFVLRRYISAHIKPLHYCCW